MVTGERTMVTDPEPNRTGSFTMKPAAWSRCHVGHRYDINIDHAIITLSSHYGGFPMKQQGHTVRHFWSVWSSLSFLLTAKPPLGPNRNGGMTENFPSVTPSIPRGLYLNFLAFPHLDVHCFVFFLAWISWVHLMDFFLLSTDEDKPSVTP